jgi:molybdenum cofactor cytidylyltransferase
VNFGSIALKDAQGSVLAHSLRRGEINFKKGRVLSPEDISLLTASGLTEIIVAQLAAGDVPEDQAAYALAKQCQGAYVKCSEPFTGRANLYADARGLLCFNPDQIAPFNRIDEGITLATAHSFEPVDIGRMIATLKIIPFAVPGSAVERALASAPSFSIVPFRNKRIALISTQLPSTKPAILDKNRQSLQHRLDHMAGHITSEMRIPHDAQDVARAIEAAQHENCELILLFGASAIIDRRDVLPSGLVLAGGVIEHFGMPVDPGNLLMLGAIGSIPVIGLPGCARAPAVNGFDFVLRRLLCDLPVTAHDLTGMGVGGLLKEIPSRPQPRGGPVQADGPHAARIGAVLLAAGRSSRMGPVNKLLIPIDDKPMVAHARDALVQADIGPIIAVTGHMADDVATALNHDRVSVVFNPDFSDGLSTSLRSGLGALPRDLDGVLIALGDMPAITAQDINRMIAAFSPADGRRIVVATDRGKRGNPVLFDTAFIDELAAVQGDKGARHLITRYSDDVVEIDLGGRALLDLDTPEALGAFKPGRE